MQLKKVLLFLLFGTALQGFSQITSAQSGNWSDGSTWTGGIIPQSSDDVTISNGHNVTVNGNFSCQHLILNGYSTSTVFSVNSPNTLDCVRFDVWASGSNQSVSIANSGDLNVTSLFYVWDNNRNNFVVTLGGIGTTYISGRTLFQGNRNTTTVNVNQKLTVDGEFYLASVGGFNVQANVTDTLELKSTVKFSGNNSTAAELNIDHPDAVLFLSGTNTWNFIGAGGSVTNVAGQGLTLFSRRQNYNSDSRIQFGRIAFDGNETLSGTQQFVNGEDFVVFSGTIVNLGAFNLEISGDATVSGALSGSSGTLLLNGNQAQTISFFSPTTLPNLAIENTSGGVSIESSSSVLNITNLVSFDATGTTVFNTNGKLVLKDNGSGMANLGNLNNHTITGDITCQFKTNTLSNIDYRNISMPVSGVTIADVQYNAATQPGGFSTYGFTGSITPSAGGFFSTYSYNNGSVTGDFNDGWVGASNTTNPLNHQAATTWYIGPGTGSTGASSYSFEVSGSPIVGGSAAATISSANGANLSYDAGNAADNNYNWALVGNPFPSSVDWNLVTRNNIESTMYIFSADGSGYTASNSGGNSNILPPFQGFWVRTSGSSASMQFEENDKSTTQRVFQKSIKDESGFRVYINSDQTTKYSFCYVKFNSDASEDYVAGEDALRRKNPSPWPNIAVISSDNEELQVSSTSIENVGHKVIPIHVETFNSGNHTLRFEGIEDIEGCIVLEDVELNTLQPIDSANSSYAFSLTSSSNPERFKLHIYNYNSELATENSACFDANNGAATLDLLDIGSDFIYELKDESGNGLAFEFGAKGVQEFTDLAPGNYSVEISPNGLNCKTVTEYFTIHEPGEMSANFGFANQLLSFRANKNIEFKNLSEGTIKNYSWDFGDNTVSTEMQPKHTYTSPGIYDIVLTAENGNTDCNVRYKQSIEVAEPTAVGEVLNGHGYNVVKHNGRYSVEFSAPSNEVLTYTVYDIQGKEIHQESIEKGTLAKELVIESNGIVLLNIQYQSEAKNLKLLVQ